ncbi:MAG: hypothetical protein AMXMBFR33_48290 [Candidatus Xenobia bacterium]|jgi:hypothetical protein
MLNSLVGAGVVKNGASFGVNRAGENLSGHRTAPGQWSFTNQDNGAQLEASRTGRFHWDVTRTDASGQQSVGDFTVLPMGTGPAGGHHFRVYDFNHNGFQPV